MSVTSWFLVSSSGTRHRLPREMIFVGREDCELMLQSRSVDKQHAVINYNPTTDEHLVKDLGSLNGTFVNDLRIPDQTYITLKLSDIIRFGYDILQTQHKVPEEALKYRTRKSFVHAPRDTLIGRQFHLSHVSVTEVPVCRPTPLYGQPSWWGEEDYGNAPSADPEFSASLSDCQPKSAFPSYHREPSYFEIPTKDFQHPKSSGAELHEIPTKDTDTPPAPPSPPTPTPPVVQSHASFTIEFDDCMPGKIKIKDHITKFSTRQRKLQATPTKTAIMATPAEVMSAESKVADWLVHSDVSMMKRRPPSEDVYSTKSDLAMNIKTLKGHHHEDGTQSDSEDPVLKGRSKSYHSQVIQSDQSIHSQLHQPLQYQAFIIEFFDDNPRKKRSQSFTHNPAHADSYSTLRAKLERRKGGERPASVHGHIPPTQQVTVPLKGQSHGGPQRSSSLKREKTEGEAASSASSSRTSSGIIIRPFGSVGKKSKLAQEFAAEFLKDSAPSSVSYPASPLQPPAISKTPVPVNIPCPRMARNEEDDSLSDAGTYTIETESQDKEVEEARNMIDQVPAAHAACLEGPKWVSRWASLADSYAEPGSTPPQVECLEGESESSHSSRTRRLLPQVPPEKLDCVTPSIMIRHESYQSQEPLDRTFGPSHSVDSTQRLSVQDDVDPDSLSDASRSDDGPVQEKMRTNQVKTAFVSPGITGPQLRGQEKVSPSSKSTCFYIGSEDHPSKPEQAQSPVQSEKTRDPPRTGVKPNSSAPNLQTQDKDSVPTKDSCTSSFIRQESFTKDQPSDTVQMKKLPHISSHPSIRDMEQRRENIQDTQSFLQEGTLSSLDAKFPSSGSGRSSKKEGSSSHMDDSLSGESDVDTASTVSQVSSKNTPVSSTSKKHPPISSLQKERSSSSPSIQEKGQQLSARERLSEKRRNQITASAANKAEAAKRFQMRRSAGNRGSLDLSEGQQGSGPQWTETPSSDHETSRPSSRSKKLIAPLQKEDNGKTPRTATQQVLTRSNSLSAPRPTRASMLRRARLGEASDNEGAETDRGSQNSDHIVAAPKVSTEGKKLSRLDILAMPRKRTGSFTNPSDTEASSTGRPTFSNRNTEAVVSTRKTSVGDNRQTASRGGGAPAKQPLTRTRSSGAKYAGSSRRRQKGSDFSSSSDEEYETSGGISRAKRSSHPSTSDQTPHSHRTPATRTKSVSLETEEDEDQNDVDPYQNWSTHSAEIAKLSQDLAKDLAILAKEIHDVAGDGDSPSSGMGTTTSPSSLPNTPASTISAREELVQRIPEASLNYQKVPPGSAAVSDLDANMNEPETGSKQRRPWNREEVILDNLMLNPVSQLSQAIRENTEQLAEKMKVLFQNKAEVWEEIEAKINTENEVPILKTSNKEITSILKELRRVQRQLEVINTIVEPGGGLQAAAGAASLSQTRPSTREKKPSTKPRGAPNTNESTKRPPRGPDGAHNMA
uniref:Centrosomal protein 170Bb n=1 Tax=Neolamprologus brichardi TaxID=32507 RepID=A0A3Q4GDE6_NEOBR